MKYLVSYDITSDRARNKSSKILEDYGVRIQYSVFECVLNKSGLNELKKKLDELINKKCDSVIFLPICENCYKKKLFIGVEYSIKQLSFVNIE